MATRYVTVEVPLRFDVMGYVGGLTVSGVITYIKSNNGKIFTEAIMKKYGVKAVVGGWVGWTVSAITGAFSLGMSLAGYTGMTIYTKCAVVERTHHQNGDVTVVTTYEPRGVENVKLYK